jgi:hypothetical protein
MANNQDIAVYKNDLYFVNDETGGGDFGIAESDTQHVMDTIAAFPGWWKENPPDGVGVFQYLNSAGQQQVLERSIKVNLISDGYKSDAAKAAIDAAGNLTIEPNAEKL